MQILSQPDPELDALRLMLMPYRDAYIAERISTIIGGPLSVRAVNQWKAGRNFPRPELLEALAIVIERPTDEVRDAFSRAQLSHRNRKARLRAAKEAPRRRARAIA